MLDVQNLNRPVTLSVGPDFLIQKSGAMSNGAEPPKGESVIYKIPPAFWIIFFLVAGYLGMRAIMED